MENSKRYQILEKLSGLILSKFSKQIIFTDLSQRLQIADQRSLVTVRNNPKAKFVIVSNDVLLPIYGNETLFGYITLFNAIKMEEEQLEQIRSLVDLLFTEICVLEDKEQKLSQLEHQMSSLESLEDIIQIGTKESNEDIHHFIPEISVAHESLDDLFPILVQSHTRSDACEFAYEVHRTSDRMSFLTFEKSMIPALQSSGDIKKLGPITLFIPNIRDLDLDFQLIIENYLNDLSKTTHHPRIIIATQENPEILINVGLLSRDLFHKLCTARVKLPPKGSSAMTLEEILSFFERPKKSEKERHLRLVATSNTH